MHEALSYVAYGFSLRPHTQVGFPVDDLVFNPELACRGLIIDKKLGNLVKVDRFGQVKRAMHGTRRLSIRETHDVYGRSTVELRDSGVCGCVCIYIHIYSISTHICVYIYTCLCLCLRLRLCLCLCLCMYGRQIVELYLATQGYTHTQTHILIVELRDAGRCIFLNTLFSVHTHTHTHTHADSRAARRRAVALLEHALLCVRGLPLRAGAQFTCFTSTQVQILARIRCLHARSWWRRSTADVC